MNEVTTMNTHKDCYMHTELAKDLDMLRANFMYWSNREKNTDKVIVSHSVCLHGTSYLLTIVYYVEE